MSFKREINRASGSILLDGVDRWGLQTSWTALTEQRPDRVDTLTLGNANVTYRFLQSRRAVVRAGLGANAMIDGGQTDWGINAHLDSDWFFKRPFIASAVFDIGTLGSSTLTHLRGTIGVTYRGWEAFGGYDWLRIVSTDINGPLVGVRLWF